MSLDSSQINETSNITNKATARRFVLPIKIDKTAADGQKLITLKDCTATATLRENSDAKPLVFLEPQHLTRDWMELPRINYNFNGGKYNYFYAISSFSGNLWSIPEPDSVG